MVQVVECRPSKCKALSSNSSTVPNKRNSGVNFITYLTYGQNIIPTCNTELLMRNFTFCFIPSL
jgi:hypothetical protein